MVAALILAGAAQGSRAGKTGPRLALVIGNSGYQHLPAAASAGRDAKLVAAALRQRDFSVDETFDLKRAALIKALGAFTAKVKKGGPGTTALIYYGGHGVEIAGKNVLVPVDAELTRGTAVDAQIIGVQVLVRAMAKAGASVNLIFLDVPRDNPRQLELRRPTRIVMARGTMLAYATASGSAIKKIGGRYGAYALALHDAIMTDGLKMPQFIRFIRSRVLTVTKGRQVTQEITGAGFIRRAGGIASRTEAIDFRFDGRR